MKNIIFSFFVFAMLISCINENTGYRLVGKNGRVIYLEKKRPAFNQEKLKEKEQIAKQNDKVQQFNDKTNKKIIRVNEDSKINDNLVLESSAYSLRSVIDTMVDNKDINTMARVVEKKQKPKTIKDFKIPESYFNSEKSIKETPIVNNNNKSNKVINLNNTDNLNKTNNKQKTQKKEPLFNTLFSHKKNQNNSNLKPITEDISTKNKIINTKKSNNNKNIDNDIIKRNEDIKNEFLNSNKKSAAESNNIEKTNNNVKSLSSKNNSSLNNKTKDKIIIKDDNLIKNRYYIQLGSYNDIKKANKTLNEFNSMGNELKIVPVSLKNQQMYRVVVGTFGTKSEAEKVMEQIIEKGHFDVFIFKK